MVWEDVGRMPRCGTQVSTVDVGTRGSHARAWGPNWRGALVWEGPTIHSVSGHEAGVSVQGEPGSQCNKAQNMRTGFSVENEPRCA